MGNSFKVTPDLAVLKTNGTIIGEISGSGLNQNFYIDYGDGIVETTSVPMHEYTTIPPYLLNTKDTENDEIVGLIFPSNNFTDFDVSRYKNLLNLNISNNNIPLNRIDDILIQLDNNGLSNGKVNVANNSGRTNESDVAVNNLTSKGWEVLVYTTSFIMSIDTTQSGSSNETFILPLRTGFTYNFNVNWGDGQMESVTSDVDVTHVYAISGTYQISIDGVFPQIYFANSGDKSKVISIDQWGDILWESFRFSFYGCNNLNVSATDYPNLENTTDLSACFRDCINMNGSIGNWDTSTIQLFENMFRGAINFNQDIGNWNTVSATSFNAMFRDAISFDQDIGDFNISNLIDASNMFLGAGMSTINYDYLLIGWYNQTHNNNVVLHAGTSLYCQSIIQRNNLIADGWTIVDGGQDPVCTFANNYSVLLDGINDYVLTPIDLSSKTNVSVAYYIKVLDTTGRYYIGQTFVGNGEFFKITYFDVNGVIISISDSVSSPAYVRTDQNLSVGWHHIVVTYDGTEPASNDRIRIYIDGVENTSLTYVNTIPTLIDSIGYNFALGFDTGSNSYSNCNFDEISIWDITLNSSQVTQIYNTGVPIDISGLSFFNNTDCLMWLRLGDEVSGTTLPDQTTNANDGTLVNGAQVVLDTP